MRFQPIPDRIERVTGLTIEQYRIIRIAIDEVQEEIYNEIIALSKGAKTFNQLHQETADIETDDDDDEREDLS